VVTAVRIEGRTKAEVSRDDGVSPRWVYELCRRFDAEGDAGLEPRSRRPRESPHRIPDVLQDEIVELRKHLLDEGLDAGAHTISFHLTRRHGTSPSVATIWRILSRRGFVTPQPQKRPRSSFVRFEAEMPNERWQADITHWKLAEGEVEILNVIDDHSRFLVASVARRVFKAADVVGAFHGAASAHVPGVASHRQRFGVHRSIASRSVRDGDGTPAARGLLPALEPMSPADLREGGAVPPDPQAVAAQAAAGRNSRRELQAQLDRFARYYNGTRPHRALGRGIYPPLLADKGLASAIEAQSRKVPMSVSVETDGIGRYPQEFEAAVYFCVLESLQNVSKYAGASEVSVRVWQDDENLVFAVTDDGHGFDRHTTR
jgi:transposase InsO family protein